METGGSLLSSIFSAGLTLSWFRIVRYSLVVFPVIIGIGLPLVLHYVISKQGAQIGARLTDLMNAFAFFFAIGASAIPTTLAAYSLVIEKVEKSLEPLLASPITDSELLFGKGIGAFVPSIVSEVQSIACDRPLLAGLHRWTMKPRP